MYVRLYHGRENPNDQMDDWGFNGPIIGECNVSWTYGTLRLHASNGDEVCLPILEDMIFLDGCYYGDFEILSKEDYEKLYMGAHLVPHRLLRVSQLRSMIERDAEELKAKDITADPQPQVQAEADLDDIILPF
jgi:hypothetical protein